jgi:hypothetical protein
MNYKANIGDRFYYSGDMANEECEVKVLESNNLFATLDNGMRVEHFMLNGESARFQPFEQWKANRQKQIMDMYARMAQ